MILKKTTLKVRCYLEASNKQKLKEYVLKHAAFSSWAQLFLFNDHGPLGMQLKSHLLNIQINHWYTQLLKLIALLA